MALREIAAGRLWVAEMAASRAGFQFGARMTVARLPDGGLFLHSPIALTPALRQALDAVGPVRHIVSPSRFHYEHVPEFARAYPEAQVWAVPSSAARLRDVRPRTIAEHAAEYPWRVALEQSTFQGSRLYDEAVFFQPATRTLIVTDLLFNIPSTRSWTTTLIARVLGVLGRASASRSFGMMVRDLDAVRSSLARIAAWDFDRILLSHGDIVETGGKTAFEHAFDRFLK